MLEITRRSKTPLQRQIHNELLKEIASGSIKSGETPCAKIYDEEGARVPRGLISLAVQRLKLQGIVKGHWHIRVLPHGRQKAQALLRRRESNLLAALECTQTALQ